MEGKGWATGSDVRSRPTTEAYREGWDRIFGKKKLTSVKPTHTIGLIQPVGSIRPRDYGDRP